MRYKASGVIETKELAEDATGVRSFEGMLSTPDVDRVGDVVEPEAFRETLAERKTAVPLLFNHNHDQVIGHIPVDNFTITEAGVFVRGILAKGVARIDEIWSLMKQDVLNAMSFGFMVKNTEEDEDITGSRITKLDLFEGSVVTVPANAAAVIESALTPLDVLHASPAYKALQATAARDANDFRNSMLLDIEKRLPYMVAGILEAKMADQVEDIQHQTIVDAITRAAGTTLGPS